MPGDWEKEKPVEPSNHLMEFYAAIMPPPAPVHDAKVIDPVFPNTVRFGCTCSAKWSVSIKEHDAGIDHIEDHRRYAKRTATRVD